jgi:hypothetical protein
MYLTWSINISPSSLNWSLVYNFDYESIGMNFHEIHYNGEMLCELDLYFFVGNFGVIMIV